MLQSTKTTRNERIQYLLENGYPAYTTQIGWLGYSDETMRALCRKYLAAGFKAFKMKVGQDLQNDIKRCRLVRDEIGWENQFMIDANQTWNVPTAIEWVKNLKEFKPLWIEEPTSPDDILGHAKIAAALREHSIGVATGEMCCNRVMFKQFMQADALEFCQIDSARIGGVNEILAVYLMAKKLNGKVLHSLTGCSAANPLCNVCISVKVCPHAGGVGLCEMVQHLQMWDFCSVSCTLEGRMVEFVDQQHDQFVYPATINAKACYVAPRAPGYSTELKEAAIVQFEYPHGTEWKRMFDEGMFTQENY
uniref:Mandelate racemase/muconate lactonizing enzyme C-terminal domain-containing protein n=1 Tax=Anopheles dirus TaxID=7168 RepID=A0A182NHY0_9DIPT